MADPYDQLNETKRPASGGNYAPWWNDDNFDRQEGDQLVGVVVERHNYEDPGHNKHPVVTIKATTDCAVKKETEVATPTHSAIIREIENSDIGPGDLMLIEFTGTVKANTGRDTNTYDVSVLHEDEWADMDGADEIQEIWDSYDPNESADTAVTSSALDEAVGFAEDCVAMNDGELSVEDLDEYLNDIRDYGLDVEDVVEASETLELDDGVVTN